MLSKIIFYGYTNKNPAQGKSKTYSRPVFDSKGNPNGFKSLYMPHGVSFQGISSTGACLQSKITAYHTTLAKKIGVNPTRLKSVLSAEDFKEILTKAKPENFCTGNNFENVLNGKYFINTHSHSIYSDGSMSIEEILEQAAKYGNYRKNVLHQPNPVIIGITDHDTVEGVKEAIKLIANNPEKYNNIRLVAGIEFSTKRNSHQFETLAYCIDPFEEKLNNFLEENRNINKQYLEDFLKTQVNKWEESAGITPEQQLTLEKITKQAINKNVAGGKHLRYFGSPGLMLGFTEALKSIFFERGWKFTGIDKFSNLHNKIYNTFAINPGTPEVEEITKVVKSAFGFCGIAHPCKNFTQNEIDQALLQMKKLGVDAAECNYQYTEKTFSEDASRAIEKLGLYKTGGYDTHGDNIFTRILSLFNLPEKIQKIIKN